MRGGEGLNDPTAFFVSTMSPDQALPMPLPISSGRAPQDAGAPNDASAPQGQAAPADTVSVFGALMAALTPPAGSDTQGAGDTTADPAAPAPQTDTSAALPAQAQTVPPVLPQLVQDLQAVAMADPAAVTPEAADAAPAPSPKTAKTSGQDIAMDLTDASAPVPADAPVPQAAAIQVVQIQAVTVQPSVATPPAPQADTQAAAMPAQVPASRTRVSSQPADADPQADKAQDDDGADAGTDTAAVEAAVPAAAQAQPAVQPQSSAQSPVQAQTRSVAPVLPKAPAKPQAPAAGSSQPLPASVPVPASATVPASAPGIDAAQGAAPAKTPARADSDGSDAQAPAQAAATPDTSVAVAAPTPMAPKTDALGGALKTMRKALTDDASVASGAPASRPSAPSGFTLQQPQAEVTGSYTATGAQAAGMTEGGSNLARATVENLSAMAVQINRKLSEGNTKFAVELHPADLGKVEVTLNIARDGTTTAHLKFDTPVTAAAFQAHEGDLRHQLAQTGLNLDSGSLTFSSRDDGNGGSFSQAFAQSQQQDQQSQSRQSQARAFQNAAAVAADADTSAAASVDAGLLAMRAGGSSTLALNLIV